METSSPPHPAIDLSTQLYFQLVYTLTTLLPPPLDDSPEALRARNHAAIAKVAALLPVNANEADLAAQCIAARAQAEDILRLLRQHAGDIALTIRLNAQYTSMVRTSLSVHARLMRVQAIRQKREAIAGAADQDAWTQHVAEQTMLAVLEAKARPRQAASPEAAQPALPEPAPATLPEAAPAADPDQTIEENVSEHEMNSQDAAFETWLSEQLQDLATGQPDACHLHAVVREAMAEARLTGPELPANARQSDAPQ
jgi:hypothetical protein